MQSIGDVIRYTPGLGVHQGKTIATRLSFAVKAPALTFSSMVSAMTRSIIGIFTTWSGWKP